MINRRKFLDMTALGLSAAYLAKSTKLMADDSVPDAVLASPEGEYPSHTPRYIFADTLKEQEVQLKNNPLMLHFAESRKQLSSDPYRPAYHFVGPENMMNDPNGLCFWQGRWHLFYQAFPTDEFPGSKEAYEKVRAHWGHAVSEDLVHWRDLPYSLYPGVEKQCLSGGALVENDRVIVFYPGIEAGQMVATSYDPLLLNWNKTGPVNTGVGDSDIWKEGDNYYGLVDSWENYYPDSNFSALDPNWLLTKRLYRTGVWISPKLWVSKDLHNWELMGDLFLENTPFTDQYDEGKCPYFKKIGDKYILLSLSHKNGGQYLLGDYDVNTHKFRPYDHGRFNHGKMNVAGVVSPSAANDGKGGVINIFTINEGKEDAKWAEIMSLPQHLTLGEDERLRIEPVKAITTLRGAHRHIGKTIIPADREIILKAVQGNVMELEVEIDPKRSRWVQLNVLRSLGAEEQTSITFYNADRNFSDRWYRSAEEIVLDGSRSSILPDVWIKPPEKASIRRSKENLKLRVFIDRSVVEVYVNNKQYLAIRVYPGRKDSLGVSLRAHGQSAELKRLDAWQMKPIWPMA